MPSLVKRRTLLAVMSLSSVCLASSPTFAQKSIEYEKEQLRSYERDKSFTSESRAVAVLNLAEEYERCGKKREAEQTFRRALKMYKQCKKDNPGAASAELLITWAQFLQEGTKRVQIPGTDQTAIINQEFTPAELRRIDKLTLEALIELQKCPDNSSAKSERYLQCVRIFDKTGNKTEKEKCEDYLLSTAKVYEQEQSSSPNVLLQFADILFRMSDVTIHVLRPPSDKPIYKIDLDSDSVHTSTNFARAELMKLSAIRLYDRLPKDDQSRIGAHKSLALWYMLFKKDTEAARETKILSELMGTTDEKILFPKYLGCGSFENKKLAQLCGTG